MTVLPIPDEAVAALADGKRVELQHPDLGRSGYNGTVTLDPEEYEDPAALESTVTISPTT